MSGSEGAGKQGCQQPGAYLAISPTQCLTTKGRAIKANRSHSLGAKQLVGQQNTDSACLPNSLLPASPRGPPFLLPSFRAPAIAPQPSPLHKDQLCGSLPPSPVPRLCLCASHTHSLHSLSLTWAPSLADSYSFFHFLPLPCFPPPLLHPLAIRVTPKPGIPRTLGSKGNRQKRPPAPLLPTPLTHQLRAPGSLARSPCLPVLESKCPHLSQL